MLEDLSYVAGTALWRYGLIACAKTEQDSVRILPKWAWLIIVIIFGSFGALAWLFAGRPKRIVTPRLRSGRVIPPDDDPEFLKNL